MRYEYGPLSLAMRYGGLFLINEVDLLSPEVAVGLNGVLEGAPLCLPENGGEVIHQHEMFRIACTGNTNGGGDDTGLYQGTGRMNLAWLDRFMLCEVNYPDAAVEKDLLVKLHPALPEHLAVKMVDFANEIRKQFIGASDSYTDTIEVTLSTRTLLRWADLTLRFQPLAHQGIQPLSYALDRALGFRASRPTRAMLHELLQRMFPMVGKPFPMRWRFSGDVPGNQAEAWPFLRMIAWMETLSGNCCNAPSKNSLKTITSNS